MLGNQIDTRTIDARNIYRVVATQAQLANGFAVDMRLGDDNTTRNELLVEVDPIRVLHINSVTEHHLDSLYIIVGADDQHLIAFVQKCLCISNLDLAIDTTYT